MKFTGAVRLAGVGPKDFVKEFEDFICRTFDFDSLKEIRGHGDGARYISKALEDLPEAKYVPDRFHIERDVRRFCLRSSRGTGLHKVPAKEYPRTDRKPIRLADNK